MIARPDTRQRAIEALQRNNDDIEFRATGGKAGRKIHREDRLEIERNNLRVEVIRGLGC